MVSPVALEAGAAQARPDPRRLLERALWWVLGAAGVAYAVVGVPVHKATDAPPTVLAGLELVILLAWGILAFKIAQRRTGWERAAWRWLSLAGFSVLAAFPFLMVPGVLATAAGLAVVGALSLVVYALAFVGMLVLATGPERGRGAGRLLLDAAIIAGSLFFMLWSSVYRDLPDSGAGVWQLAIAIAYPLVDAALLTVVVVAVTRNREQRPQGYGLLALGLVAQCLGDLGSSAALRFDAYLGGRIMDAMGWLAMVFLLASAVAVRRSQPWMPAPRPPPSVAVELLPLWALLLALGAAVEGWREHGSLAATQFYTAVLVIALVMTRLAITVTTNRRLARDLASTVGFKTQLLRFLSHEVANPLSPLRVQLSLLRRDQDPAAVARSWQVVDRSMDRLVSVTSEVRDMALAESGRLVRAVAAVPLAPVVAAACTSAESVAALRGIRIEQESAAPDLRAGLDGERFGQVLDNLLSNAIKFSPDASRIRVRIARAGGDAVVQVTDQGIGLSPAQRAALFVPFARHNGDLPGLGLGLYLCRMIVEAHGGTISVASPGQGHGATFTVRVPAVPVAGAGHGALPTALRAHAGVGVAAAVVNQPRH